MYTLKVDNNRAEYCCSVSVDDIDAVAKAQNITLNNDQLQTVLTLFCANILHDPGAVISTSHIEALIKDVVEK